MTMLRLSFLFVAFFVSMAFVVCLPTPNLEKDSKIYQGDGVGIRSRGLESPRTLNLTTNNLLNLDAILAAANNRTGFNFIPLFTILYTALVG